ncbi:MAG: helicase, partial [Oscillospiraceae bacterium]|nr:helicase [Oscillospiraceae bacterium]
LSYAEIKALCTGDERIKERMELDVAVSRLRLLKASHMSQQYELEDQIVKVLPQDIAACEQRIRGYQADIAHRDACAAPEKDSFSPMEIEGVTYTEKKAAGSALLAVCKVWKGPEAVNLGQYRGFTLELGFNAFQKEHELTCKHTLRHTTSLGTDLYGNLTRIDNLLSGLEERMGWVQAELARHQAQLESARQEAGKPFPQEAELAEKTARLNELNIQLNLDQTENAILDEEPPEQPEPQREEWER